MTSLLSHDLPQFARVLVCKRGSAWYVDCPDHRAPYSPVAATAGMPWAWGPYAEYETAMQRAHGHVRIVH